MKTQARFMVLAPTLLLTLTLGICLLVGCVASLGYDNASAQDAASAADRHLQVGDYGGAVRVYAYSLWVALNNGLRSAEMSLINVAMHAAAARSDWAQALWLCERGMDLDGRYGVVFTQDCATYRAQPH